MATRGRKRKHRENALVLAGAELVAPNPKPIEGKVTHAGIERLSRLGWFKRMDDDTKAAVEQETEQLSSAMLNAFRSKLAMGQHLGTLQSLLEGNFVKYLRNFGMNQSTCYRYIAGFRNAAAVLDKRILDVAAARGINLLGDTEDRPLGVFTAAAKKLPPPKNPDAEKASQWLDNLNIVRKQLKAAGTDGKGKPEVEYVAEKEVDPQHAAKEIYRVFRSRNGALDKNPKTKRNFLHFVVGLFLTEQGISNPTTFEPVAIPDDFRQGRGRPRLVVA